MPDDSFTFRCPRAHWLWQLWWATLFVLAACIFGSLATAGLLYAVTGSFPQHPGLILALLLLFGIGASWYAFTKELRYVRLNSSVCTLGFLIGSGYQPPSELTALHVGPPGTSAGALRRILLQFGTRRQKVVWLPEPATASLLQRIQRDLGRAIILPDAAYPRDSAVADPLLRGHLDRPLEHAASLAAATALRRKAFGAAGVAIFLAIPIPFGIYGLLAGQLTATQILRFGGTIVTAIVAAASAFLFAARARAAQGRLSFASRLDQKAG